MRTLPLKTLVIYHSADFDGLFSAAVCSHFLNKEGNDVDFMGWDFGDDPIAWPDEGTVYVVDLPPNCLEWENLGEKVQRLIWIDHHKTSIDKFSPNIQGFRLDGVAACRLCWQWFVACQESGCSAPWGIVEPPATVEAYRNREVGEPLALTLAGEYDVWDKQDHRAEKFQFGLTAARLDWNDLGCFLSIGGDHITQDICQQGESALEWQQAYAERVCEDRGYYAYFENVWFWVLASAHARNSMWFPDRAIGEDADALMCVRLDGTGSVKISLYHRPGREDLDLSEIARKFGGGGHKGACGFELALKDAVTMGVVR